MKDYLHVLNKQFDIVAVSETWLNSSQSLDEYQLEGYDAACMNRQNKRGGGVMLYVSIQFDFKIIDS